MMDPSPPCFEDQPSPVPALPAPAPDYPSNVHLHHDGDSIPLAALEEMARHLFTELQSRRKEADIKENTSAVVSSWVLEAQQAKLRTVLAEEAARCAGEAARTMAAESEKMALAAADSAQKLQAVSHENQLLKTRVQELMTQAGEMSKRERDAHAWQAAHEAKERAAAAAVANLNQTMAESDERLERAEANVQRLEVEFEAEQGARAQRQEEREKWRALEKDLRAQLALATQQLASMAATIGSLSAKISAGDVMQ